MDVSGSLCGAAARAGEEDDEESEEEDEEEADGSSPFPASGRPSAMFFTGKG